MTKSSCALLLISLPVLGLAACGEVNTPATNVPDTGVPDTGMDPPTDLPDTGVPDTGVPEAPRNLVFVTSTTMTGNFGGRDAADTLCNRLAQDAGHPGVFRAYLSTTTESAPSRLGTARGWVRTDGMPFADQRDDLVKDGKGPFTPARLDETGKTIDDNVGVWTATRGGTYYPAYGSCGNWIAETTPEATPLHAAIGDATLGGTAFQFGGSGTCTSRGRLLCFQIEHQTPVAPPPTPDHKLAFLSSPWRVTGGLAAADAHCKKNATDHGITGNFRAVLAVAGSSAASRFLPTDGPWKRPDGMPLTKDGVGLFDESSELLAPNAVDLDGANLGKDNVYVGAATLSATPTNPTATCSDWMTASGTTPGRYAGQVTRGALNVHCDQVLRMMCLETAAR